MKSRLLDQRSRRALEADADIDLAVREIAVIQSHDNRLVLREGTRNSILPGKQTEVRQLVAIALLRPCHDMGERTTTQSARSSIFLTVQENTVGCPLSGIGIIERLNCRQIRRTETREVVVGGRVEQTMLVGGAIPDMDSIALDEVFTGQSHQIGLRKHPLGDEGPFPAVSACDPQARRRVCHDHTAEVSNDLVLRVGGDDRNTVGHVAFGAAASREISPTGLVIDQQSERTVAVVVSTHAVRQTNHLVTTDIRLLWVSHRDERLDGDMVTTCCSRLVGRLEIGLDRGASCGERHLRDMHRHQLTMLHELTRNAAMHLNVPEEPTRSQDLGGIQDTGGFLIDCEESVSACRRELSIGLGNIREILGLWVKKPNASKAIIATWIFLNQDFARFGDFHIVHHNRKCPRFCTCCADWPFEHPLNRSSGRGVSKIVETQAPQARGMSHRRSSGPPGRDAVEIIRVRRIPVAVLYPEEGCAVREAQTLQLLNCKIRSIVQLEEAKTRRADRLRQSNDLVIGLVRDQHSVLFDADRIQAAVVQTRLLNVQAGILLGADVDIHLAVIKSAVVHSHDDG